jgi:hypothetical protein
MFWLTFISLTILCFTYTTTAYAANPTIRRLLPPRLDQNTWVMIEIWPEVNDITLSAYFMEGSSEKNRDLCDATKRVFDRDQDQRSKALKKTFSSYRFCMSLNSAIQQGYVDNR